MALRLTTDPGRPLPCYLARFVPGGPSLLEIAAVELLPAETEFPDQRAVALDVFAAQVFEEAAAAADHTQEAAPGVMVLRMCLQVLGELRDPTRENGDLDLGRACVIVATGVVRDDLCLLFFEQCHTRWIEPFSLESGLRREIQPGRRAA